MAKKRMWAIGVRFIHPMIFVVFMGLFIMNAFSNCYACGSDTPEKKRPKLDVPYEPTSYGIAHEMLNLARVKKDDVVYDLGCGDGRLVIMAAKERGAYGVGVDLDPERIKESIENAKRENVLKRVRFYVKDLFKTDIKRADVVFLYLWPEVNLKLRPKLFKELRPGARVVSHSHNMGDWEADGEKEVANHRIYLWIMPANVEGVWELTIPLKNGEKKVTIGLSQSYQKVRPLSSEVKDVALEGEKIRFTLEIPLGGKVIKGMCEGYVAGNFMSGKMGHNEDGRLKETFNWKGIRIKR